MKKFIKANVLYFIGGIIGALLGYIYYLKVGCMSGSCPITSSPTMSIVWGAVMGALVLSMFKKSNNKSKNGTCNR